MSGHTFLCDDSADPSRTSNLEIAAGTKSAQKRNLCCTFSAERIAGVAIALMSCQRRTGEGVVETLPEPGTREWWEHQLDVIIRLGCYPAALAGFAGLVGAPEIVARATPNGERELAQITVDVISDAMNELGDPLTNPRVRAGRILLGLDPSVRGLPLKDRRFAAARQITVRRADGDRAISVETWLRNYEQRLRYDLSWQLANAT